MNMQIVVSEVLASPGAMNQSKLAPPGPTGARAGLKSSGSLERNSIVNQGQVNDFRNLGCPTIVSESFHLVV